ncbi:MAG: M14 family metallopeptidase [Flavobacteriaceae bacterium]
MAFRIALLLSFMTLITQGCQDSPSKNSKGHYLTHFEVSQGEQTPTYAQVIAYYHKLAEDFTTISIYQMGQTDSGEPLHLVVYKGKGTKNIVNDSLGDLPFVLINNGIHPGESDGIDASMMLMRDLAQGNLATPNNISIGVIPIYNIGGALNRNSGTRTNQNGPKEYGFRGNAQNFDLNRDFIKSDTKNAIAFAEIFHTVKPFWFVDTHVSNGADYQYTLTHLFTQHNKLGGPLGDYVHQSLMPDLENMLAAQDWPITPYVNVFNQSPEFGFNQFIDHPRYSTGYTTLFHTAGMMIETHMLKPYKQRVMATYALLADFITLADQQVDVVAQLRQETTSRFRPGQRYAMDWTLDTTAHTTRSFLGFEAAKKPSALTGFDRLFFDRNKPYNREIAYQDTYRSKKEVVIPHSYIIPKTYDKVITLLKANDIQMTQWPKSQTIDAEVYYIDDYKTSKNPFEGHYLHSGTKVRSQNQSNTIQQGDWVVPTDQWGVRYLLEVLEPEAIDSFFNWNFFDTILQQKEGFSPYVWEDLALEFLENHPEIRQAFTDKKAQDQSFADNWYAQLDWLHKQSIHYESAHLRYPIVRVMSQISLGEE